jgi:hypothetical protein
MKRLFILLILCGVFASSQAQRTCATMDVYSSLLQDNPSLATTRAEIEAFTQKYVREHGNNSRAVITIPVVIHIVYNTTSQNISDAQAQSQIAVLNADYSKTNADISSVPSAFAGLAANANIQFCLAQRDPNGAATTGIVRKSTTVTSFSTNDAVKYTAQGGDNAWPSSSYLNLWCCPLGGGLLGYAQFPGGTAATDGVVILCTAFGNTGTAAAPYNKGRTATHEVGHWLNLYHIWGDDNGACTGSDNVNDTPNQASENYGCPTFPHVSCSNGPNGDMFMNYMDYTDDACMFMFSTGQNARMQALFATGGARASLVSSLGCTPPTGGGTTCGTVSGLSASSITTTSATLSWTAVSGATSYNVEYKPSTSTTWTTSAVTTTSKALTGLTAGTSYDYAVQAVCSSGSSAYSATSSFVTTSVVTTCTDAYESNNTRTTAKTIAVNTDIKALINTSTDKDYFKFTNTTAATNIRVTLSNLPADYDLKLYNSSGTLLYTSQNGGTTAEVIKYNNAPVGTYTAYVYGYSSAFNATSCYTLNASIGSVAWRDAADAVTIGDKLSEITYNVYPNPNNGTFNLQVSSDELTQVSVKVVDMLGNTVAVQEIENVQGVSVTEMNLNNVAAGIYHVLISNGKTMETKRIVVEK